MREDDRWHPRMCEACERGEHWHCGMQTWCQYDDPCDGDIEDYFVDLGLEEDEPELAPDNEPGSDCP